MKTAIGILTSLLATALLLPQVQAQNNYTCETADEIVVTPVSFYRSTVDAFATADCINGLGKGVWYRFIAPGNGQFTVHTTGSDFDAMLILYTGDCSLLTSLGCATAPDNGFATNSIPVTAGTTYYVLAGGYQGDSGNLALHASFTPTPLPGVVSGSVAWGDYDNDGHLDILLTGYRGAEGPVSQVRRNDGNGNFVDIDAGLPGVYDSSVAWGDYDNDGDLDFVLTGLEITLTNGPASNAPPVEQPLPFSRVYRNEGGNHFHAIPGFLSIAAGDNFSLAIKDDGGAVVWGQNISDISPVPTAAQSGLAAIAAGPSHALALKANGSVVAWRIGSYDQTFVPVAAQSNVVAIAAGYGNSMALTSQGRVVAWGRSNLYRLTDVPASAQSGVVAIAAGETIALALKTNGSVVRWGEQYVNLPAESQSGVVAIAAGYGDSMALTSQGRVVAWGDDLYGLTKVPTAAQSGVTAIAAGRFHALALKTNGSVVAWGNNLFGQTDVPAAAQSGVVAIAAGWNHSVALRNDGRIVEWGSNYRRDDYGQLVKVWDTPVLTGLPGVQGSAVAWGDYDNDGRLDILLTGLEDTKRIAQVWRNTGSGFTNINAGLPGVVFGSVAWGDYDNDGLLDILLTGASTPATKRIAQVWRNTGSGFTNINAGLPGVSDSSAAWGDYDNDGRLDILLTGDAGTGDTGIEPISQVWRNTGTGFTNINAGLPGVRGDVSRSVAWGDYDDDGYLDILLTGQTATGRIAQIWRNTGSGFVNVNAGLPGVVSSSVAWGDYDNDGRLDILLSGGTSTQEILEVETNASGAGPNTPPSAPTGLTRTWMDREVILDWSPGSDAETPTDGLNYNLRLGSSPGGNDLISSQAAENGRRLLPAPGNKYHTFTANVDLGDLPIGTYYWSVQAVDTSFAGSAFATNGELKVYPPEVTTLPATDVQSNNARLQSQIVPHPETVAWFEYGLTTQYGHTTDPTPIGYGDEPKPFSSVVTNLLPWMTYHFRAVASNHRGLTRGADQTVSLPGTSPVAPVLSHLSDVTLLQGTATAIAFTVFPGTFDVQVRANNPVLLPANSLALGGAAGNRTLSLNPDPDYSGAAQITVLASDGTRVTSETFTLNVTPSPTASSGNLYLTDTLVPSAEAWQFRVASSGGVFTNLTVEYRSDLTSTNNWLPATNVTFLGGDWFEVNVGPPQGDTGFYRVKGIQLFSAGMDTMDFTADEGVNAGAVVAFNGPYQGLVTYDWTDLSGVTQTNSVVVNGNTAVLPIPLSENSAIDQLGHLTLRLLDGGAAYSSGGSTESTVTLEDNDSAWDGVLDTPSGSLSFVLNVLQTGTGFEGQIYTPGAGFFPTNTLAQLTFTKDVFAAAATNVVPRSSLSTSPLFSGPHHVDLRLDAVNTPGQTNIQPNQIQGQATLVSVVTGKPYLDTAVSGTFVILKRASAAPTNQVPLTPVP